MTSDPISLPDAGWLWVALALALVIAIWSFERWRRNRVRTISARRRAMYGMMPIRQPVSVPPAWRAQVAEALARQGDRPQPTPTISGPVAWVHGLRDSAPSREEWEQQNG